MRQTLRQYFQALGRHNDSPLTVGDLLALDDANASEAEANELEAMNQLELASEPTAAEVAGTSAASVDRSAPEGMAQQEDTARPPLALV